MFSESRLWLSLTYGDSDDDDDDDDDDYEFL